MKTYYVRQRRGPVLKSDGNWSWDDREARQFATRAEGENEIKYWREKLGGKFAWCMGGDMQVRVFNPQPDTI